MINLVSDEVMLQSLCRDRNSWGIKADFHFHEGEMKVETLRDEIFAATKGLIDTHKNEYFWLANALITHNGSYTAYLLFSTESEMMDAYENRICGDDNFDHHPYSGPLGTIRCLTCTPRGMLEYENS